MHQALSISGVSFANVLASPNYRRRERDVTVASSKPRCSSKSLNQGRTWESPKAAFTKADQRAAHTPALSLPLTLQQAPKRRLVPLGVNLLRALVLLARLSHERNEESCLLLPDDALLEHLDQLRDGNAVLRNSGLDFLESRK